MTNVIENLGEWVARPFGDGWTTFERLEPDGSKTVWNDLASELCPLDANGTVLSSKHPFYARVDRSGTVLNCYEDIWRLVPHECLVIAVDEMIETGTRFIDGEFLPPLPTPVFLSAEELFFGRMTDDEYDALDDSVRSVEGARVYRGWAAATSFTEGTDMWALLVKYLTPDTASPQRWKGVSDARRAELLSRP